MSHHASRDGGQESEKRHDHLHARTVAPLRALDHAWHVQQLGLLGATQDVTLDEQLTRLQRIALDESAWVEHCPAFVRGHESLFARVERSAPWRQETQRLYDREMLTPRLVASLRDEEPWTPIQALLEARYGCAFPRVSAALYRDGRDSVAPHGDTIARTLPSALVATVSLGAPRKLRLSPKAGGASIAFALGEGDLFVMGGSCQRTWKHGIAMVAHAGPRIAIMFRPVWQPLSRSASVRTK